MEKPRLSRLTAILTQLQSKQLITAREISEKYEVSTRTVYRDIRTLENSGIPIITEEGKGFSIMPGYYLPPVSFSEKEALALITAEQFINKNKDLSLVDYYGKAMSKVKSILKLDQKQKVELLADRLTFKNNLENNHTSNLVMEIQTAITNFDLIHLTYNSLQNETTKRDIEPFAVYSTQDNWLLIAFCRMRKEYRKFRVDCITSFSFKNERFTPHKMTLQEYFNKYG
ncbi:helix-turn-helix transcriptional regulator [Spongiivirga citrea]|uniref:HTH domain-containing protein n=1 Tax=Spongiivirga citrea TaxID=1481457 RepID=A0A6M0CLW9_9FLAO|nr:WYL domain-containing protein [Spongiivirga citrea]NER18881.1 HTH domain-containing protein [Spongiivirga citrea]